jgi:hypothetical protein
VGHEPDALIQSIRFANLELDDPDPVGAPVVPPPLLLVDEEPGRAPETPPTSMIAGVFRGRIAAGRVCEMLIRTGLPREHLGLVMSDMTRARQFGHAGAPAAGTLAELAVSCVFVPAVGMYAVGSLLNSLTLLGSTKSPDGLGGALMAAGLGRREATRLARSVQAGGILIAVEVEPERAPEVRALLRMVRIGRIA